MGCAINILSLCPSISVSLPRLYPLRQYTVPSYLYQATPYNNTPTTSTAAPTKPQQHSHFHEQHHFSLSDLHMEPCSGTVWKQHSKLYQIMQTSYCLSQSADCMDVSLARRCPMSGYSELGARSPVSLLASEGFRWCMFLVVVLDEEPSGTSIG